MKKIWISLLILFSVLTLSSCKEGDISKILFIASVGIEKKEDQYQGFFYLPLSSDIGKAEGIESEGKGEFAKTTGKSISELFHNIAASTSLTINLKHVSSIVLSEELFEKDFLIELMDFIKYSLEIDFNFYLFATKEKLEDIYDFKNPNQESVLYSLLVSTNDAEEIFLVAPPIHFLVFVRDFYKDRSIKIPLLILEELWTIEGEKSKNFHAQSAIFYYHNRIQEILKHPSSPYLSESTKFTDTIEKTAVCFSRYKMNIDFKDILTLTVKFKYEPYKTENTISNQIVTEYVKKQIQTFIYDFKESDPLNIEYYNSIYHTNCSYDSMKINIQILTN